MKNNFKRAIASLSAIAVSLTAFSGVNGENMLKFDGISNYINFPREALPYGSFTLEFEILPQSDHDEVLFRNYSFHQGFINLYRKNGCLEAHFTCRRPGVNNQSENRIIKTGLPLPENSWSKIKVAFDLKNITFKVNDRKYSQPFAEQGVFFKSSVFGGHTHGIGFPARFYRGLLKNLRIRHTAE